MSVRFLIGRSGVGKTRKILNEIKAQCETCPHGDPIFVIVPDQMSFHTEYQLLKQNERPSLMRVQGLSFNRLAYRVLQEMGGVSRHHLNEVGLAILLQKVMNEQKAALKLFPGYINKPGFIQKVSEIISELKSYSINSKELVELFKGQQEEANWSTQSLQKLNDLAIIYEHFNQVSLQKYLMSEDYYTLLSEQIATSQIVAHSDFYIDGYHLFNKQEELILFQLMKYAKSVTIVQTHELNATSQVFALPARTYSRLLAGIREMKLNYKIEEVKRHHRSRFSQNKGLAHLEKYFLQYPQKPCSEGGVAFFNGVNRRTEIEEVAKRIHRLVHDQGYTYSDIAIYTGDPEGYDELIRSIFKKFEIPIFLDAKESMLHHPLMTLLYHLFDVLIQGWHHEGMFTLIKTGLFIEVSSFKKGQSFYELAHQHHRQVDLLENYCLARNISKLNWQSAEPWEYKRYKGLGRGYVKTDHDLELEQQLNQLRTLIAERLVSFEKALRKAKTYKDFAVVTFEFLEKMDIPQKLSLLEESALELNEMKQVKQHEQVWNQLLALFEQLVEIGREESVTLENFAAVFKAGLEEMTYATVPPCLDQVSVGQLRRSRYQLVNDLKVPGQYGIKHAFVLGVNEGIIPSIQTESSLINEKEREQLKELGFELAPSLEQNQVDEQFILYSVFTSPKESLTLSYVSSNDEGKEYLPSYIYGHLKKLFPKAPVTSIGRNGKTDIYDHLTTVSQSVAHVIAALKATPEKRPYYEPFFDYYQKKYPLIYQMLLQILHYQNEVIPLDEAITKQIYSDEIVASVSRLELFNQCEFSHYVQYGLQLKERELYRLDLPHIGELYHEALKRIATLIQNENKSFSDLTKEECYTLAENTSNELSEQLLYQILKRNKRMINLMNRLTQVVYKTLMGLKYQGEKSAFKPLFFELPFDTKKTSGIQLKPRELNNGFRLSLKGIVDRVDLARINQKAYLRIVDYKSSQKQLNLDSVYYGLSLQLLTYLDVVISNSFQLIQMPAEIGGLLYFHVHHPFINQDEELLQEAEIETIVNQLQQDKYKMTGYLPEDYEVATLSDQRLGGGQTKSNIVPVTLKKDGSFSAVGNALLSKEDLDLLRAYTKHKIEESALKITEGHLHINPTQYGSLKACDHCAFRSVCQFDTDFHGNKTRILPKLKSDHVLETIKSKIYQQDEV